MTRTIPSRIAFATLAVALFVFGYMGFCVTAMLHVSFPITFAIAHYAAQHGTGTFLAWMSSGAWPLVLLIFAIRE